MFNLFKRKKKESEITRRNFLKGLAAAPVVAVLPISPQSVDAAANASSNISKLSDKDIALIHDADLSSPYLYVQASEDIKQGDFVERDRNYTDPYVVKKGSPNGFPSYLGIALADFRSGQYGFIQDVAHMPIQPEKKITRYICTEEVF